MDDYKKVKVLGRGSFGEVWEVENLRTGKRYAAKYISLDDVEGEEDALKEIQALQACKHPFVVEYISHTKDTDSNRIAIYMELCEGKDTPH